jgi:hypothetical protein
MPTIEELEGLYAAGNNQMIRDGGKEYPVHIAKPFVLTSSWQWSSTLKDSSSTFSFLFADGRRGSLDLTLRYYARVLCVRRSGE